jgi:hypothetical protein
MQWASARFRIFAPNGYDTQPNSCAAVNPRI